MFRRWDRIKKRFTHSELRKYGHVFQQARIVFNALAGLGRFIIKIGGVQASRGGSVDYLSQIIFRWMQTGQLERLRRYLHIIKHYD